MIKIIIITYLFLFFTTFVKADIKTEIILNLKKNPKTSALSSCNLLMIKVKMEIV